MELSPFHTWLLGAFVIALAVFVPSLMVKRATDDTIRFGLRGFINTVSYRIAIASGATAASIGLLGFAWFAMLLMAAFGVLTR